MLFMHIFVASMWNINRKMRSLINESMIMTLPNGACLERPVQLVLGDVEERLVVIRPCNFA